MRYERLSPEDEQVFLKSLMMIWDAIGMDCLQAVAYAKGIKEKKTDDGWTLSGAEQVRMRRSEVISIVTDNFASSYERTLLGFIKMSKEQYNRIREWMIKTPSHIVDKIVEKEFHYKWYGA